MTQTTTTDGSTGRRGPRAGGAILVDQLAVQGTTTVYCVPGESYLPVLDALYDRAGTMAVLTCRHEANAANMAVAAGKLTGRPGVCFVTRGPGATHASIAVHTAMQDSAPMVLFVGQVPRAHRHREAFQELPVEVVFGGMAKWAATIDDAARIPEYVARAYQTAMSGRAGPVVLALPEDVLAEAAEVADAARVEPAQAAPDPGRVAALRALLQGATRPTVVVGGSGWDADAVAGLQAFVERHHLPVVTMFRRQDLMATTSPSCVGALGLGGTAAVRDDVRDSDVVLLVGARVEEGSTADYSLLEVPTPRQRVVHVHAAADDVGALVRAEVGIVATPGAFVRALDQLEPLDSSAWRERTARRRADRVAAAAPPPSGRAVDLSAIVAHLGQRMPAGTIYASGAGNFTGWAHRYLPFTRFPSQLAPTSGAMGFGVPAAVAAAVELPDRQVVAVAGDGDFLMAVAELATTAQYGLPVLVVVVNNAMYGTIRMHQERRYPGRVIATDLANPDFADLARAFGWHGEVVAATDEFAPALDRALAAGGPALIEVRTDPDQLAVDTSLTDLQAAARTG